MKRDANDVENLKEETESLMQIAEKDLFENSGWTNVERLGTDYPELRPYIIQGLIREGEVINLIAPPKSGKSILAANIAFHVAAGKSIFRKEWLTCGGSIAIIDTELHKETISHRMNLVLKELNFNPDLKKNIHVFSIRGKQMSLFELAENITMLKNKNIKLIIVDCLYKLLPKGTDENSNADMVGVYNYLETLMTIIPKAALMLIHHTSKGSQFSKSISDIGSGAGVQSRATDCHMILREHEENGYFVIDAITRSFRQPGSFVVKYDYPTYKLAEQMNAEDIKGSKKPGKKEERLDLSGSEFADFLTEEWLSKKQIVSLIRDQLKCSYSSAGLLVDNVSAKYGLESLTSQDGEKDCDFFIAANIKGLKFKRGVSL
jgi:hypothetical protein